MKICDVCKKELSLGGVAKVVIPHWLCEHVVSYDMCKECANKVDDFIEKLKEEARRQEDKNK